MRAVGKMLLAGSVLMLLVSTAHACIDVVPARNSFPHALMGKWCFSADESVLVRGQCPGPDDDGGITVQRHSYLGIEKTCRFKKARWLMHRTYFVQAHCEGEGSSWAEISVFRLVGGELHVKLLNPAHHDVQDKCAQDTG
jgi:hypothetical protein